MYLLLIFKHSISLAAFNITTNSIYLMNLLKKLPQNYH